MELIVPLLILGYCAVACVKYSVGKKPFVVAATWPLQALWEIGGDVAKSLATVDPALAAKIQSWDTSLQNVQNNLNNQFAPKVAAAETNISTLFSVVTAIAQKTPGVTVPPQIGAGGTSATP